MYHWMVEKYHHIICLVVTSNAEAKQFINKLVVTSVNKGLQFSRDKIQTMHVDR